MKDLPYFRWWVADAEVDEKYNSLSDKELGFFHRCLNRAWINEGLPADLGELAACMHVTRGYLESVWKKVGRCFFERDGRLYNPRQEQERAHVTSKSGQAADAANKRWSTQNVRNASAYTEAYAESMHRARASESESESDIRKQNQTSASSSEPVAKTNGGGNGATEFPLTLAECRKHDPAIDRVFATALANRVVQACLSSSEFPQDQLGKVSDKVIAKAVQESYNTGPANHRAGLLLTRVPPIVITWGCSK